MEINELLKNVIESNASDLIINAGIAPVIRVGGELQYVGNATLNAEAAKELIYSMLSDAQKKTFEATKELDVNYEVKKLSRFRVNVHYQRGTVAAALRVIPSQIPTLEDLRLPRTIADIANEPRGLILVTGPTGSGKTTTQACMLDMINANRKCHVITVEDPIEYVHRNRSSIIEQREIGGDTDSFNQALKHVLRQDPDVILVGEMRDLETIQTAITAAETGHLVISTLHTNDAVQAIDRMVDVFPQYQQSQIRMQLSLVLQSIIAQQLLPRADKKGVVAAIEILRVTSAIRNLIRKAQTYEIYSMLEIGTKQGMQSMDNAIKELYGEKAITYETALAHAVNQDTFKRLSK
ncbi:type IV pilus twitching motility protein PilT [Candidatus Margulisiibacteriota bacterium]